MIVLLRVTLVILGLMLALLGGLIGTTAGLQTCIEIADRLLPGRLNATVIDGRLFDRFELVNVSYEDSERGIGIETGRLTLDWLSLALLRRNLQINDLQIDTLRVQTLVADATDPFEPIALQLPWTMELRNLDIRKLEYLDHETGVQLDLQQLHARMVVRDDRVTLQQLTAGGDNYLAVLHGNLQLTEDWPLKLEFRYTLTPPDNEWLMDDVDGQGTISGDMQAISIDHRTTAPLHSHLELSVTDILGTPGWFGHLSAEAFELQAYTEIDSRADIHVNFDGDAAGTNLDVTTVLDGEVQSDWSLAAVLAHENLRHIDIISLQLQDHGRQIDLIGQGTLALVDVPDIDFAGDWHYLHHEPVTGKLRLAGKPEDYRIELSALTETPIASSWTVQANGDTAGLTLEALRGELAEGVLTGSGHIDWSDEIPRFRLDGAWHGLILAIDDDLPVHAPGGEFSLSGTTEQYMLELAGDLSAGDWPSLDLTLRASGDTEQIDITMLEVALLDGVLRADGSAILTPAPRLNLNIHGERIDPGRQWPDWPGRIDLRAGLTAERIEQDWQIGLQDVDMRGVLRDYPLQASGHLQAAPDRYQFDQFELYSGDSMLALDGQLSRTSSLEWRLRSPDLAQLWPDAGGQINSSGRVHGHFTTPEVIADITGAGIQSPWLSADSLQAEINLDIATDRFDAAISASDLHIAEQVIDRLSVQSQGTLERHSLRTEIVTPTRQLDLSGSGSLQDETWRLQIHQITAVDSILGEWQLSDELALSLHRSRVKVESHCWQQQQARLCGSGQWQENGPWQAELELAGLQLEEHVMLPEALPLTAGALEARLAINGDTIDVVSMDGSATLSGVVLQPAGEIEPLAVDELTLTIADAPDGFIINVAGKLDGSYPGELDGELLIGRLQLSPDALASLQLDGRASASIGDLRPLIALYTGLDARRASASLEARIAGAAGAPDISGRLQVSAARITVIDAGLELADLELLVEGEPQEDLVLRGQTRSGPGRLEFEGRVGIDAAGIRVVALDIHGENFESYNLPEAWVLTSPDLRVEQENRLIRIDGKVLVPEALLEPLEATGAITTSPDEIIVEPDVDEPPVERLQIAAGIRLQLGDEVRVRGPGFSGRLTGSLDIRQQAGQPAMAEGTLNIVDGTYGAYGQELRVTTGEIIYTGQQLDDPELNIRATRSIGAIQVGVYAYGSALRPEVELFSTPTMPESDILSYLILGRPVSGLASGEGNMLMDAAVAMGLRGTESLQQNIAGALGLDELTVTAGGPNQTDTRLTIGKYITPRLYISYGAGLVETAIDTMRMRYTLTRRLVLEAEQGQGTGADLLYQIER